MRARSHVGVIGAIGAIGLIIVAGCSLRGGERTESRKLDIQVSGATLLKLDAGAGYLRVTGARTGATITATGTARAGSRAVLRQIQLETRRSGDTLYLWCAIPAAAAGGKPSPALDLSVQVPSTLALLVTDSAGAAVFHNVGPLTIHHGDGRLEVDTVSGALNVTDGAGDMVLGNVAGDVSIVDGAGFIHLSGVRGSVVIPTDGSGELHVENVTGNVSVGAKQSGEVLAQAVGGDLVVNASGSGSIEYHDVRGHVTFPGARHE